MAADYRLRHIGDKLSVQSVKELLEIKSDTTIIGRNKQSADLYLDSSKYTALISRMHSRIIRTLKDNEYQYEIYDTSLNGTYVNDHKISGSLVLNDGDVIVFGHLRGAVLGPGAYAPQKDSEFIYKFEKITQEQGKTKEQINIEPTSESNEKAPVFSSPKTPAEQFQKPNPGVKLHDHLLSIPLYENTPSDKDLSSLAKQVSSTLGENSDDELSLFPLPMPDLCLQSTPPRPTKPAENIGHNDNHSAKLSGRNEETPVLSMNPKGSQKRKMSLEKENVSVINTGIEKKPKQPRLVGRPRSAESSPRPVGRPRSRGRPRSDETATYCHDVCASLNCKHPKGAKNTWVQCDDCDKWFHLKCAGLTEKRAKKKSTVFHCGC